MHKLRVIVDNNNTKVYNQYNQICNLLPNHLLYIYKRSNNTKEITTDYNLYFDTISERVYDLCPSKHTILLTNDEYIDSLTYLRRETYIDKPLIAIKDIVDYYFCLTLYAKNILISKYKIKKEYIYIIFKFRNINFISIIKRNFSIRKFSEIRSYHIISEW